VSDLSGKVALVTGASRGLGEATARLLAHSGARVVLGARTREFVAGIADDIGEDARALSLDVTSEQSWASAVDTTLAEFGRLDVLVNNAAIYHGTELADTTLDDYRRVVDVDQVGVFLGMRAVVEAMTAAGGGSIVNVGSIVSHNPYEGVVAYAAAKAAVAAMTRVAAMELGRLGIRVNVVNPGGMQTQMSSPNGVIAPFYARIAAGRIAQPVEVARVVAFLASDESSYCTGAEFCADGGWSLGRYRVDLASGAPAADA
jgi:3alpha(or 20beta)-hydroxysteroid dehydrogenase